MSDLVEFLLARIAEDEAVARAATAGPWQWWNLEGADQGWSNQGPDLETVARGPVYSDGSQGAAETVIGAWGHDAWGITVEPADAAHIARHDPARVLAECEAKRRIVEWCGEREMVYVGAAFANHPDDPPSPDQFVPGHLSHPTEAVVLRFLARPYADHPDYRDEWRP